MKHQKDDGIPIRSSRQQTGRRNRRWPVWVLIPIIVLAFAAVRWVVRPTVGGSALAGIVGGKPSHDWNHAELIAHLRGKGIVIGTCNSHASEMVLVNYAEPHCESVRWANSAYVACSKHKTEREAHDIEGLVEGAFEWGLYVFSPHGPPKSLDFLANIKKALP